MAKQDAIEISHTYQSAKARSGPSLEKLLARTYATVMKGAEVATVTIGQMVKMRADGWRRVN